MPGTEKITNIVKRVSQLVFAERPPRPIGKLRALVERHADELGDKLAVADLLGDAGESRGDLRVAEARGDNAEAVGEQRDVLLRPVGDGSQWPGSPTSSKIGVGSTARVSIAAISGASRDPHAT